MAVAIARSARSGVAGALRNTSGIDASPPGTEAEAGVGDDAAYGEAAAAGTAGAASPTALAEARSSAPIGWASGIENGGSVRPPGVTVNDAERTSGAPDRPDG